MYDRTNEPKCKDVMGHSYRPVGGNTENPGCSAEGDMLLRIEQCKHCHLRKISYIAIANTSRARMQERTVYCWPSERIKKS
jgi:hypothetical protein